MAQQGSVVSYQGSVTGQYLNGVSTGTAMYAYGLPNIPFLTDGDYPLNFDYTITSNFILDFSTPAQTFAPLVTGVFNVQVVCNVTEGLSGIPFLLTVTVNNIVVYYGLFDVLSGETTCASSFSVFLNAGDKVAFFGGTAAADGGIDQGQYPAMNNVTITKIL